MTELGTETQTTATETTATETVQTTQAVDFTKLVDPSGKLQEGWKNALPEDLRHEVSLDTFQDIPEMVKQYVNAQKMIGKNKIAIPTDNSTPSEWDAFYTALGRPKTKDDYKINIPQGYETLFDETMVNNFKDIAHKCGLSQKQMDMLIDFRRQEMDRTLEVIEQQEQKEYEAAEKLITESAGEALDSMMHDANLLLADEMPDAGKREKLLEALNSNSLRPYVIEFLANIQRKYRAQHSGLPAGDAPSAMTPASLEAKANELMATPGYLTGEMKNTNPAGYARITQEITDLYKRAGTK
jgi:hypothetical protein